MNNARDIAHQFYTAFKNLDAEGMNNLYAKNVLFKDPAFGELNYTDVKAMWTMLCNSQKDKGFKLEFEILETSESNATIAWQAWYTFTKTNRPVHNKITAQLTISDGKIVIHHDEFSLHNWASQAFGLTGKMLGWTSFFQNKLQAQTKKMLSGYQTQEKTNSV